MARELSLSVEMDSLDAEAAIARLHTSFLKAGDSADVAAAKVEKFEKSYKDGRARTQAKKELDALAQGHDRAGQAAASSAKMTDQFSSAIMRFAGPAVVLEAARRTLLWADAIDEAAQRTNLSTTYVQQLTKTAEKNGTTFQTMAGLIQASEQRLVDGNKKATAAIDKMGLSVDALIKMSPEERFREIAKGLASIENPAERSAAEMAVFGRAADGAAVALNAVAAGADKTESALGPDFISAGARAQDMLETLTNKALELGKALLLLPVVIGDRVGNAGKNSFFGTAFEMMGLHHLGLPGQSKAGTGPYGTTLPGLPGSPGGGFGMPSPLGTPGDPFATGGVGGQSMGFIERSLGLPKGTLTGRKSSAKVLPFRQSTFATGSAAASIFAMANTPGGFNAGSLPFMSSLPFLQGGASPISFANGSGLAGTVPMNAPGGGGGIGGWLSGHKTQLAGAGLGLLSRFIPTDGKIGSALSGASQGASMGAMFGPWGMGIGAAAGGLMGLFTGGKAKKNAKNAEISEVFAQFSSKEFIAIQKEADRLGVSMEKALNAKTMKDFGAAVEEVTGKLEEMTALEDQIKALTDAATVDFDKMNAVVKEFGLDINKMGPAFQQAAMDKEFQKIIDALAVMEKGGADMNGVLDGMQDEISKVVQDSLKFGTTIPENMRPWIDKLIESGRLVDENGEKITDTSKMKFGAPMASEMEKVILKLDELIQKLADLTKGFQDAGTAAGDLGDVNYPNPGNGGGQSQNGSGSDGFATGGVAGRDFRRPGHGDIFPALLKRGERVLPAGASGGMALSVGNISIGGGYGSRTEAVEEIGDALVSYLERRGARLVA